MFNKFRIKKVLGKAESEADVPSETTKLLMQNVSLRGAEIGNNDLIVSQKTDTSPKQGIILVEKYPLNEPYAYAQIVNDGKHGGLTYQVLEPKLNEQEAADLKRLKNILMEILDVNIMKLDSKNQAKAYLENKCEEIIKHFSFKLSRETENKLVYYVIRDCLGLDRIDPLMHDQLIEDISCDGTGINFYVWHRKYESIPTNIRFENADELNSYALRLAYLSGSHVSIAQPMLDASLPDGSRLNLTYGHEITRKGSTFTIRKFKADPLTI